MAITVRAAVTTPKSSGRQQPGQQQGQAQDRQPVATPRPACVHKNPRTDRRPTPVGSLDGTGLAGRRFGGRLEIRVARGLDRGLLQLGPGLT